MNTPVTIITTGRVTADLELKTSQNGKNTKYVQFGLAVNKGYGEKEHPNFYNCLLYGEDAQRIIDAKVKKGSLIQIIGGLLCTRRCRCKGRACREGTEFRKRKTGYQVWCHDLTTCIHGVSPRTW